ncbi:hypothetical protein [Comamonas odontotermitis]|uniref:hypothetical protein n=1 Tax=Comamonas odontotermitis TaxID=379895 RepID=UPI003750E337
MLIENLLTQRRAWIALAFLGLGAGPASAQQALLTSVSAQSNIFYAGTSGLVPPTVVCTVDPATQLGDGALPPSLTLPVGMRSVQFRARNTSDIRYGPFDPGPSSTPDGAIDTVTGATIASNPSGTMPGMALAGRYGLLGMVFLNNDTVVPNPSSPAASTTNTYTVAQMNAPVVSPALATPFFLGDGSVVDWPTMSSYGSGSATPYTGATAPNGTQQRQTITLPTGATRMFFGQADSMALFGKTGNQCYMDNAGAILTTLVMAISDDSGAVQAGEGGVAVANVRTNDYLEGVPPTAPLTTIAPAGTWTAGITLDAASGAVNVAPTVAAGVYQNWYELCDTSTSPASCQQALVTVTVNEARMLTITAVPDTGSIPSATGGTPVSNVRSNDLVGTAAASAANSTLAVQGVWPPGITLNTTTGAITVAGGTPADTYVLAYQLCDSANAGNCTTTTAVVNVTAASATPIAATADTASITQGATGQVIATVRSNDTMGGNAATGATTTLALLDTMPAGIAFDTATGEVSISSATLAAGTYSFTYTLCQTAASPANCSSAVVSITVKAPISAPTAPTPPTASRAAPVPMLSHGVTALLMALVVLVAVRLPGKRAKG